jgi:hypothetical protein
MRSMGLEPITLGFGVRCSTIGAMTSIMNTLYLSQPNLFLFLINQLHRKHKNHYLNKPLLSKIQVVDKSRSLLHFLKRL